MYGDPIHRDFNEKEMRRTLRGEWEGKGVEPSKLCITAIDH